jgi:hypothetical protein
LLAGDFARLLGLERRVRALRGLVVIEPCDQYDNDRRALARRNSRKPQQYRFPAEFSAVPAGTPTRPSEADRLALTCFKFRILKPPLNAKTEVHVN